MPAVEHNHRTIETTTFDLLLKPFAEGTHAKIAVCIAIAIANLMFLLLQKPGALDGRLQKVFITITMSGQEQIEIGDPPAITDSNR